MRYGDGWEIGQYGLTTTGIRLLPKHGDMRSYGLSSMSGELSGTRRFSSIIDVFLVGASDHTAACSALGYVWVGSCCDCSSLKKLFGGASRPLCANRHRIDTDPRGYPAVTSARPPTYVGRTARTLLLFRIR